MDRKFRLCRLWSNKELEKFAGLFDGKIINVSAWQDKDKGGSFYKNYFNFLNFFQKSAFAADISSAASADVLAAGATFSSA